MKTPCLLLLLAVSWMLPACAPTSRRYADSFLGYSVTRGSIVKMENVSSENSEYLSNGVALKVNKDGGKVVMRMGELVKPLEIHSGSIIILSDSGDYLLNSVIQQAEISNNQ